MACASYLPMSKTPWKHSHVIVSTIKSKSLFRAVLCHAAQHYSVQAHGVTPFQAQHDYAKGRIEPLDLSDRVTVAQRDYMTLDGSYDKIASIGIYKHVRIANSQTYF